MRELPKLSIIVPVYNVEKYLSNCLESLLCQDVDGGYEIVCINDGSKDSSAQILNEYADKYPEKIRVFEKTNGGVSSARNLGIEQAKGKYVTFVDSDDYILPNSVGMVVDFLEKENAVAAVVSDCNNVEDNSAFSDTLASPKLSYELANTSTGVCWGLFIIRNVLVDNCLKFKENMPMGEDTVFVATCQLYYWNKCLKINGGYYCYRKNPNSVMHTRDNRKTLQCHVDMLNSYKDIFKSLENDSKVPTELKKQFKARIYTSVSNILYFSAYTGEDFLEQFKREKLYPYPIQWWTLREAKSFNGFIVALIKQFFIIECFYKLYRKAIGRK